MIDSPDKTSSRLRLTHGVSVWALTLLAGTALAQDCEVAGAEFTSVEGIVEINRAGTSTWVQAAPADRLCFGDTVRALAYSRAALRLPNGADQRLGQNSTVRWMEEAGTERSVLELLKGLIHVISRDSRSLIFTTPFANAGLEGTEFLIAVTDDTTEISVIEGVVSMDNANGSLRIGSDERGFARSNAPPALGPPPDFAQLLEWTLYYSPVWSQELPGPDEQAAGGRPADPAFLASRAARRLSTGRVEEALADLDEALAIDPMHGEALALKAVVAAALNDSDEALRLAESSVAGSGDSATVLLALAHVQQSRFDLAAAEETLVLARARYPGNALVLARLAEIRLATGDVAEAARAAAAAIDLDPGLAHAHTVLGFARLMNLDHAEASESFSAAISADQAAPLPRLGLGLTLIRIGNPEAGRRQLEEALLLKPNDAVLRGYIAKAYYDEGRDPLAARQLEIAKGFDVREPTPFVYDSVRKQAENRPVEALRDSREAASLNDRQAVYRSRLRLDEDLAVRSASHARVFRDLGFEQLGLVDGWNSVSRDPGDYSGHRMLADTYSSLPRHEIARVNELFVSQILQPVNVTAIPPELGESNLLVPEGTGPDTLAFGEFNPLMTRNHWTVQGAGVVGDDDTRGERVTISGISDRFSYSLGKYGFETNGIRENNDLESDIRNAYVQFRPNASMNLLAELRSTDTRKGDLRQLFDATDFDPLLRQVDNVDSLKLGIHHARNDRSQLLGAIQYYEGESGVRAGSVFSLDGLFNGFSYDLQSMHRGDRWHVTSGINLMRKDLRETSRLTGPVPFPPFQIDEISSTASRAEQSTAYAYGDFWISDALTVTLGGSIDILDSRQRDQRKINPKLGIVWESERGTTVSAAAFRVLQGSVVSKEIIFPRLEPTQVGGFNQFFFGAEGDEATRVGVAVDHHLSGDLYFGAELSARDIDREIVLVDLQGGVSLPRIGIDESLARAYTYATFGDSLGFSAELRHEVVDNNGLVLFDGFSRLRSTRMSVGLRYFRPGGFRAGIETTFVDQTGDFGIERGGAVRLDEPVERDGDQFWVTDAFIGYKLPGRHGVLHLGVENLFDESFRFQDTDPEVPGILPLRQLSLRFTLAR